MKKLLVLLLAAVMCFSLVACGGETDSAKIIENYENIIADYENRIIELEELLAEQDAEINRLIAENAESTPDVTDLESTGTESTEPEKTEPEETTNPTENLEEVRKAELIEILCGGKWVNAFDAADYPSDYPIEMYFLEDGTMKYIDGTGIEHSEYLWDFMYYTINREVEGQPGLMVAAPIEAISYSSEQGVYYFVCEELSNQAMTVGCSVDGEYIIHYWQYPYKKVTDAN